MSIGIHRHIVKIDNSKNFIDFFTHTNKIKQFLGWLSFSVGFSRILFELDTSIENGSDCDRLYIAKSAIDTYSLLADMLLLLQWICYFPNLQEFTWFAFLVLWQSSFVMAEVTFLIFLLTSCWGKQFAEDCRY